MKRTAVLVFVLVVLGASSAVAGTNPRGSQSITKQAMLERFKEVHPADRKSDAGGKSAAVFRSPESIPISFEWEGSTLWTGLIDVVVDGNYAYCTLEHGLMILDITQLGGQPVVSKLYLPGTDRLAKWGNHVYLAGAVGLTIVNVAIPEAPFVEGKVFLPRYSWGVAVVDTFAYVIGDTTLYVVNVARSAAPTVVSTCRSFDNPWSLAAAENLVAVADADTLMLINVSNKELPYVQGRCPMSSFAMGVTLSGKYAYVACRDSGLQVVGLASPSSPVILGKYRNIDQASSIAVAGGFAYVTDQTFGLRIIGISDPTSPRWAANFEMEPDAFGLCVQGHYVYIADFQSLQAVNVADPQNPRDAGHYDTPGYVKDVAVAGSYAYVADGSGGLAIVDVTNPQNPTWISSLLKGAASVGVSEQMAFFGWTQFWAANVSNPYAPTPVCSCAATVFPAEIVAVGKTVYVADLFYGLRIINGQNCAIIGGAPTSDICEGLALAGNYAYLACQQQSPVVAGNLRVIDVSSMTSPQEVGSCALPMAAVAVAVSGRFAYVANQDSGLMVVDVRNPLNPRRVFGVGLQESVFGVEVVGNRLFVTGFGFAVIVLDITNPGSPVEIGGYYLNGYASRPAVSGTHIYVCTERALDVLRMRICGDMDGSGEINISDAVYLINYIFSHGPAPQDTRSGDIDCDGAVTIADAVYLINYIFSHGAAPCALCK